MNVLKQYITFLKEYKKLLERGIKDVLNSTISSNFIWIDEIKSFIEAGVCESTLIEIFSSNFKKHSLILSLKKPSQPNIQIPNKFIDIIYFDENKNRFESINGDEGELRIFQNSIEGKTELEKLNKFNKNREAYTKLYRAFNDIKNDSNLEIVLSVGLIQYVRTNNNGNLSKTNQHLFHFPLTLDIDSNNVVKISFSDIENPYADFFFLNNAPIEKEELSSIVESFGERTNELGYEYIFENEFIDLISKTLQKISSNSEFESSIYKPENDYFREDYFKILFSPAINIKQRKPRLFEKLTDSIIKHDDENKVDAKLFNLLVRNPEFSGDNSHIKRNYFKDELFENFKANTKNLNGDEDFSVFFPLPFNKEQKQIYDNYLKNRLTVVTGPPGTGKSHTIVNILCSLLAQGKRVLVTAQTDKALESLLDKIPDTFDNLIFTRIQLETNQNRFSLEKSIGNIAKILTDNFYINVENKIKELDNLKAEYVKLKLEIIRTLEKEYAHIRINDSFENLRPYQIVEKFESKEAEEWTWIQDELSSEVLSNFDNIKDEILKYKQLVGTEIRYINVFDDDVLSIVRKLEDFDFNDFILVKEQYSNQLDYLGLNEYSKDKLLNIQLENITKITTEFSNSDIVIKNIKEVDNLQKQLNNRFSDEKITINKPFSNLVENGTKYLLDIETYLSFTETGKAGFFTKLTNSNYKEVAYLEQFTVNGKKCNGKTEILQLKSAIESFINISKNFTLLKSSGFLFSYDDTSNLHEKNLVLNGILKKLEINRDVVSNIQFNADFINFSDYTQIDLFDIDNLSRKVVVLKNDIDKLRILNHQLIEKHAILKSVDSILEKSSLKNEFTDFLPIDKIGGVQDFEVLKNKLLDIIKQIDLEQTFLNLKKYLKVILPNSFDTLESIPNHYISKENFEFASANRFIRNNEFIDLQKCKEELSHINKKIFQVKCDILFDLAKSNFKNKFNDNEIGAFINLLEEYRYNLSQSIRKIRNQTQYQILARKNSIDISKRLSCWVMKFNDVLNSVGNEPEIFDCIIVDEASQLDFNSLILSYYSENMIIVGDDKQTSPSSLTGADGNDFESIKNKYLKFLGTNALHIKSDNSLFMLAKMVAGTANLTLREHFRCVPEIIEFSKFHFYDNSLRPLKQINSNRLNPKEIVFVKDAFTEDKIVYREIEEIKKNLQSILKDNRYANKSIGVVSLGSTKHTEKLKDIKEELANEFGKEKIDKHKLIIEDSPKFQGDERDLMIISLGVALDFQKLKENQNAKPRAIINDQDEFKKINVALSRAKEQMILFHSVDHTDLQSNDFRNKILSFFKDEAKPIAQLHIDNYNIERNRHNVPEPFDSWFECDIAKALIENGYSYIQLQYQVKEDEIFYNHKTNKQTFVNFKLDLVVHHNGKMIAIECDGDPFHSMPEDVAYDIERQEFLERVGWKVCRVLYSAFKRSPKEEVKKIIEFIEKNTNKDYQQKTIVPKISDSSSDVIDSKMNLTNYISFNNFIIEEEIRKSQIDENTTLSKKKVDTEISYSTNNVVSLIIKSLKESATKREMFENKVSDIELASYELNPNLILDYKINNHYSHISENKIEKNQFDEGLSNDIEISIEKNSYSKDDYYLKVSRINESRRVYEYIRFYNSDILNNTTLFYIGFSLTVTKSFYALNVISKDNLSPLYRGDVLQINFQTNKQLVLKFHNGRFTVNSKEKRNFIVLEENEIQYLLDNIIENIQIVSNKTKNTIMYNLPNDIDGKIFQDIVKKILYTKHQLSSK